MTAGYREAEQRWLYEGGCQTEEDENVECDCGHIEWVEMIRRYDGQVYCEDCYEKMKSAMIRKIEMAIKDALNDAEIEFVKNEDLLDEVRI